MTSTLIIICIVAGLLLILLMMYFSYNNREIALRKEAQAQEGKIETVHDTMWKTLKQEAGVSEKYRETFEKIYPQLISGRYTSEKEPLFKMIQESNPEFDTKLYDKLMQSIESQRAYFASSQQRMLDIIREHDTICETMPACWFIKNKSKIEYTIISSSQTSEVMKTRRDDNIDLFA